MLDTIRNIIKPATAPTPKYLPYPLSKIDEVLNKCKPTLTTGELKERVWILKAHLKYNAKEIRNQKDMRSYAYQMAKRQIEEGKNYFYQEGFSQAELVRGSKMYYRHAHIAYCLVRGRSLEQIEAKVSEHNKPDPGVVLFHIFRWFGRDEAIKFVPVLFPKVTAEQLKEITNV